MLFIMMVMVIPEFTAVFEDMNMELPWITKMVMGLSDWMVTSWWQLLLILVGVIAGLILFAKTDKGRHFFGKLVLKLPLFGDMTVKSASANFARTLSTLVSSGLPMLDSLEITAKNMNNVYFKEAVLFCRDEAAAGATLSAPLEQSEMFPPMVYHMTNIGEETGDLEEMLDRLADYYDEEVAASTKALLAAVPIPDASRRTMKRELIRGEVTSPIDPKPGCRFATRCPFATAACREPGIPLHEVTPGHFVKCCHPLV